MADLKDFALHEIDWNITPEHAVAMYLEWGNNACDEYPAVRTESDSSTYFVVDSWGERPVIRLVERNMAKAEDLFSMPMPEEFMDDHRQAHGTWKGVSAPTEALKTWLRVQLGQEQC